MEAVTDVVFRHVVTHAARPDVYFTEFTNATGWVAAGDRAIGGRLVKTDDESPIIAQLWGADPISMEKMAIHCATLGYDGIDINMGCPDSSAVKSGGGSGMIRTPELAADMITAAKKSGLPVSVKTRLGYSRVDEWQDWLTHILKQDVVNLTIHLRTKKEMSKVEAHFELIPDIKKLRDDVAPHTLLTINGDIRDRQHGEELVRAHGVDQPLEFDFIHEVIVDVVGLTRSLGTRCCRDRHRDLRISIEQHPRDGGFAGTGRRGEDDQQSAPAAGRMVGVV